MKKDINQEEFIADIDNFELNNWILFKLMTYNQKIDYINYFIDQFSYHKYFDIVKLYFKDSIDENKNINVVGKYIFYYIIPHIDKKLKTNIIHFGLNLIKN